MPRPAEVLERLPMPSSYFRLLLRSHGGTAQLRAGLLAGTGLSEQDLAEGAEEISLFQQAQQIENLLDMFGGAWPLIDPALWEPTVHGALGIAVMTAPNVATMLDAVANYGYVRAPYYEVTQRRGPLTCQLTFDPTVPLRDDVWRSLMEVSFIGIRASIARVLPPGSSGFAFGFSVAEPPHAAELRAILGEKVRYGESRSSLAIPSAWLAIDSPFSDPVLYRFASEELAAAAQRLAAPVSIRGRVERLLQALPASQISADGVAKAVGTSRRTLVRRLAETGCSFRHLVDDELRRRAERMLADGLAHSRIANELGYNDPSSFSRARRRWFGQTTP